MAYIRPVRGGWISATWAQHRGRIPPSVEAGIDYAVPRGTPVVAPAAGTIRLVDMGTAGHDGRRVMIEFDNGDWGSGIHLNSGAPVRNGQHVEQGQTICYSGNSRRGMDNDPSMGPHLHWTFWRQPGRTPIPGVTPTDDFEKFLASVAGGSTSEGDEFMAKIDDLWQRWLPGEAGVKTAGDAYLLFAEVVTKVRDLSANLVRRIWEHPVSRGGVKISALQELADSKTLTLNANAKLDELLARPAASVELTDEQIDRMAAKVGETVALSIAPAVLDAMAARLKE